MDLPELDYDDLLLRIWRSYLLLEPLAEEPHTPSHDMAVRELSEDEDDDFLPLLEYVRP
jgi:hypothetical protein